MSVNAYNPDTRDAHEYPDLEQIHGEDPARFLQTNETFATARIRGIDDPELLAAYRTVTNEIAQGQYRTNVLEAIDAREAELTGEPIGDTATPTADESTTAESDSQSEARTHSDSASTELDLHPGVRKLEAGEVLVVTRDAATEYIWPTTTAADSPFLVRAFDGEDTERTSEPIELTTDEFSRRMGLETETVANGDLELQPPTTAATGGADQ